MARIFVILLLSSAASVLLIGAWYLSRPMPPIEPPRSRIDDRISLDPELSFLRTDESWTSEVLSLFGERSISKIDSENKRTIYRLVLFPSFHRPISVRVDDQNGKKRVVVKALSGVGGYGPKEFGKLMPTRERDLTELEWDEIERLIERSSFWYIPRNDRGDLAVLDGASWVLEGSTDIYHMVERITPTPELQDAMVYLLELGGVKKEYDGYYHAR